MKLETLDSFELIRLNSVPGIGPNKLRNLIARFGSIGNIFNASHEELSKVIDARTADGLIKFDGKDYAKSQIERMKKCGAKLLSFWDKDYPESLKQIYDPPACLYIKGSLKLEDKFAIGVVGTRRPSSYGKIIAEKITTELSKKGLTIVSGLAYGIDTLAHRYALQAGSRTLAILGSGLDVIYPSENKNLAEKIASNGALISEFPMGAKPDWMNFPRRNRLICGMSLGTLVIEAGAKSGALITAAMALEQNREVFAIPGNIDSPKSIGTNDLIKQGAKLVASTQDILDELAPHLDNYLKKEKINTENIKLSAEENKMLSHISHEPKHIDAIALTSGQPSSQVLALLLSLELKNLIKQLAGKYFVRV